MAKTEQKLIAECLAAVDWHDDRKMMAMMSTFKKRQVNPHEFDSRVKFWSRLIAETGECLGRPCVQYKMLLHRFTRKDRVPAGIATVLQHMIEAGHIETIAAFRAKTTAGWMSWGVDTLVKRPVGWLTGWGDQSGDVEYVKHEQFVVISVIDKISNDVMSCHSSASVAGGETAFSRSVVAYNDVRNATKHLCADEETLDLALLRLQHLGLVHVQMGEGNKYAQLIKFSDGTDTGRVKVTEIDTNIVKMRTALHKLETERETMARRTATMETETRSMLRAGNKTRALHLFKQKKALETKLVEKDKVYANMCELLDKVESTGDQRQVLDAYKSGVLAFKQTLARHGLSAADIDSTIDDIHEAMGDHEDIQHALSFKAGSVDDADLEEELEELMAEGGTRASKRTAPPIVDGPATAKEQRLDFLPEVPTHSPGRSTSPSRNRIPLRTALPTSTMRSSNGQGIKQLTIRGRPSSTMPMPPSSPSTRDRLAELRHQMNS